MDDSSDILGGQLHIAKAESRGIWQQLSFTGVLRLLGASVLLVLFLQHAYPQYKQYQERRYRKQMRRRHGIPDSDHRPFNVAYAAATKARAERETGEKTRSRIGSVAPPTSTAVNGQAAVRQRHGITGSEPERPVSVDAVPGGMHLTPTPQQQQGSSPLDGITVAESHLNGHAVNGHAPATERSRPPATSSLYQPAFARAVPLTRHDAELLGSGLHKKSSLDVEMDSEKENKRRRGRDDDEDDLDYVGPNGEWHESDEEMDVDESPIATKGQRGSKRMASLGEDSYNDVRQKREKRARRGGSKDDEEDGLDGESGSHPRGKKRDRGASFGTAEDAGDEDKSHRPRRRRVVSHKKAGSEASRGKKRGRELDAMDSDDEYSDSSSRHAARHKRGKKAAAVEEDVVDEELISTDPLCGGRYVGEQWEANGIKFKVGPNGQRLRQTLAKRTRSRFHMPEDSEHPDREVNIDVFVETWMTEDEYQLAKDKQELAWQQSPSRRSSPTETLADGPETPTKGKNLLWSSAAPRDFGHRGSQQAIASMMSYRVNPFQSGLSGRRVHTLGSAPAPETPNILRSAKTYSKWEKQDLEAAAMAKLREKVKQEIGSPEKPAGLGITAPSAAATAAAPVAAKPEGKISSIPFALGAPTNTSGQKSSTSDASALLKPPTAPIKTSTVPFPSAPSVPSKPSDSSTFSLTKPAAQPSAPPAAQSSTLGAGSVPNFFSKPTTVAPVTTSSPAVPPTSAAGQSSGARPSSTPFSFAISPPAAAAKPEAKSAEAQSSGTSLLSRLGGFAPPAPLPAAAPAAAPQATQTVAPSVAPTGAPFSFAKPAAPTTTSTTAPSAPAAPKFGFPSSAPSTSAPTVNAAPAPASTFNFAAAPTKTFVPPASTVPTTGSSLKFGFTAPSASTTPAAPTEQPKFSFTAATPAAGSATSAAFGVPATPQKDSVSMDTSTTPKANPAFGGSAFSTTPAGEPKATSAFNVASTPMSSSTFQWGSSTTPAGEPKASAFPTTTPAGEPKVSSVFGSTTTPAGAPPPSVFGSTTTPAGAPPSIFGGATTTPAGQPKSNSVFGHTTTTPAGAPNATSAFGATSAVASEPPKFSFNFSAKPSAPVSTTPAAPLPVKTESKPLTFNFGAPTNGTTTPASNPFAVNGSAAPASNPFGAPAVTNGATNGSVFGATAFGNATAAPAKTAAFSLTPPTGAFTFGAPNNGSTQK